jgi:predicted nucleotidyltransferase component of viral defense system
MRYQTAAAFRRALVDHLNNRARREGISVNRLQKQAAFERFLARLFHNGGERWILKGGYALELRRPGHARATRDLDLNVPPPDPDHLPGQVDLTFAGLPTPSFPVCPLEDHFAEKLHAYTTPRANPSRVKDLVDMLLLIQLGLGPTDLLRRSITETFERYARHQLPEVLPEPPRTWSQTYSELAAQVELHETDLEAAYVRLAEFLREAAP